MARHPLDPPNGDLTLEELDSIDERDPDPAPSDYDDETDDCGT